MQTPVKRALMYLIAYFKYRSKGRTHDDFIFPFSCNSSSKSNDVLLSVAWYTIPTSLSI